MDIGGIIVSIIVLIVVGPPIIMTFTYVREDLNKKLSINNIKGQITVEKGKTKYCFNKKDLIKVYHIKVDKYAMTKYTFPMYEYVLFLFKEQERLIITNLLCKPKYLIESLDLKPQMVYTNVPFINRKIGDRYLTTAQFETKTKEFY